jgi:hypothetical protein
MSWRQIRNTGGLNDIVKGLIDAQQRQQAEQGVEDINDLEQARVDFDGIAYTDTHTATLNGTEGDTDTVAYDDTESGRTVGPKFRLCGGEGMTYFIANAPSANRAKSYDTQVASPGGESGNERAIVGFCQTAAGGS